MHPRVTRVSRGLLRGLDAFDPLPPLLRRSHLRPPPATMLSVYRSRNCALVQRMVRDMHGHHMGLWALDEITPELETHTMGSGPGGRFQLLNRLAVGVPPHHWLLVSDDDVVFKSGGLLTFLALADRLELDIVQPAHTVVGSTYSHTITGRRPFRLGRETTFVEIGPVVAFSPTARRHVVPFPEGGMGWGTELSWYDLQREGLRLGIIDATPLRHVSPVGTGYDFSAEGARLRRMFDERGLRDWGDVQRTVRSRYFWSA